MPEEGYDVLAEDTVYYDAPLFDHGNYSHGGDWAILTKESANSKSEEPGLLAGVSATSDDAPAGRCTGELIIARILAMRSNGYAQL